MGPWNALASAYGTHSSNKNIDKQLQAQAAENDKIRKYNFQLAQQQNQWNLQQWNLENAYNSPEAQMKRMKDAGLNPDMMYGGGVSGNLAASSPDMTAGAPATPMDWTALGAKKTIADSLLLNAQLENIDAQTDKIKSETQGQDISNNIQSFESEVTDLMREEGFQGTIATARATYQEYQAKLEKQNFKTESQKYEYLLDELNYNQEVRDFQRSLRDDQRNLFRAYVREAVATANIKQFLDQMKAVDFWTDKGIAASQVVLGAIGAAGKFTLPPNELIETVLPNGGVKSVYKHYEK